jgi:hypothetical protein
MEEPNRVPPYEKAKYQVFLPVVASKSDYLSFRSRIGKPMAAKAMPNAKKNFQ